jgi:hypothetical protein
MNTPKLEQRRQCLPGRPYFGGTHACPEKTGKTHPEVKNIPPGKKCQGGKNFLSLTLAKKKKI